MNRETNLNLYIYSYRNNKKLFELFSIHIFVQEWHRTMDPEQTFLTQNLQSILFNLGITKGTAQPAV